MVSARSVQAPVCRCTVDFEVEDRCPREFVSLGLFGGVDSLAPGSHACGGLRSKPGGVDGFEVCGQLRSRGDRFGPERFEASTGASSYVQPAKFMPGDHVDVSVELGARDRGGCGASLAAVKGGARVARPLRCSALPGHDVPAGGTSDKPGEQGDVLVGFGSSRAGHAELDGLENLEVKDRFVGFAVGVLADPQFTDVDTVSEHVPNSARCHPQVGGDLNGGVAGQQVAGGLSDVFGVLVGHETAGVGVAPVAAGCLAALPDSSLDGAPSCMLESLAALFEGVLVDRGEQVSVQSSGRGASVDVFAGAVDDPAGSLDLIPQIEHEPQVAAGTGEVGDDYSAVPASLHAFDGLSEDVPVRVGAFRVELGREHFHVVASRSCPRFDLACLVFRGSQVLATSDVTDSPVSRQHGAAAYTLKESRSTTRRLKAVAAEIAS